MTKSEASNNSSRGSTDDELALMFKKFKQMLKKKGKFQHSSRKKDNKFKKKHKKENNEIICFECQKPEHMKVQCPKLIKK